MPRYPSAYDDSIRKAGERFLVHLYDSGFFKTEWDRAILRQKYYDYSEDQAKCFNRVLYHLFKYNPSLLRVRRHTVVVFDKNAADEFYQSSISPQFDSSVNEAETCDDSLNCDEVLYGRKPNETGGQIRAPIGFHAFSVPKHIRISAQSRNIDPRLMCVISQRLTPRWYNKKFDTLLHVEELRQEKDMDSYKMEARKLVKIGDYLCLDVPGLAEKRPSLLRGDRLYAVSSHKEYFDGRYVRRFEGFIHDVNLTTIYIAFNNELHNCPHITGLKMDIEFTLNRHALKMMHRGLHLVRDCRRSQEFLFPDDRYPNNGRGTGDIALVMRNRDIEGNEKQCSAVRNIVSPHAANVYIVFGPPGTGKTVTMVEAIHQTLHANKGYRILVCAPSNSACDQLAHKLMKHIERRYILRMHASSRKGIPDDLMEVSNCSNGQIYFPDEKEFRQYQVIVSTLITAGRIASEQGIFNRIFVDESGQALEPELMVALGGNLTDDGKVVLAGDPKQLGPIVRSHIAGENGLQVSYLERLMGMTMYQVRYNGEYDERCVTKLLKNYRSHESIIKISNEEFYDGELEVCADEMKRNNYCGWSELPNPCFPIIFEACFGRDDRENDSPSFFNDKEVKAVLKYVRSLLEDRRHRITPAEIGIITPYRKQVQKIRQAIKKSLKNKDIKVGSVEEFQGQERRVIILSTVRSNEDYLEHDFKYSLGFVSSEKRFNVAITRAQALLIIVGNPKLLCRDPYWRKFIKHCYDNKACIGMQWKDLENIATLEEINVERDDGDEDDLHDRVYGDWRRDP